MNIMERQMGDVVVLDIAGPIAGDTAPAVIEEAVHRHSQAGRTIVVVNLGDVRTVDLAGLSSLVEGYRTMRRAGGVMRLACVTRRIHDLLVITRLLTLFDAYDSVEEAIGAAAPTQSGAPARAPMSVMSLGTIQRFLRGA